MQHKILFDLTKGDPDTYNSIDELREHLLSEINNCTRMYTAPFCLELVSERDSELDQSGDCQRFGVKGNVELLCDNVSVMHSNQVPENFYTM